MTLYLETEIIDLILDDFRLEGNFVNIFRREFLQTKGQIFYSQTNGIFTSHIKIFFHNFLYSFHDFYQSPCKIHTRFARRLFSRANKFPTSTLRRLQIFWPL